MANGKSCKNKKLEPVGLEFKDDQLISPEGLHIDLENLPGVYPHFDRVSLFNSPF
jgi:hypothetical protein